MTNERLDEIAARVNALLPAEAPTSWADPQEAVEHGASAVAMLLIDEYTPYRVVERSFKGPGIDYWLGLRDCPDEELFQHKARLEVSGIKKRPADIPDRVQRKRRQVIKGSGSSPEAFVVVVEFSKPTSRMVRL